MTIPTLDSNASINGKAARSTQPLHSALSNIKSRKRPGAISIKVFGILASSLGASIAWADAACNALPDGLVGFAYSVEDEAHALDLQEFVTSEGTKHYAFVGDIGTRLTSGSGNDEGVLNVFDVTNPCNPALAGFSRTGTVGMGAYEELPDLDVYGDTAYVANDAHGLVVYDLSDPLNPVRGAIRSDGTYAMSVVYDGERYAYVGYSYTESAELKVYDMTTFPAPESMVASYNTVSGNRHATSLYLDGDRLYLRALNGATTPGFEIVDVADPTTPTFVGYVQIPVETYGTMGELVILEDYAYVTTGKQGSDTGGIVVIDISDESSPVIVGATAIPDASTMNWENPGIALRGNVAYIPAESGLYMLDISDPLNIIQAGHYPYPPEFLPSKGGQIVIKDGFAYVTSLWNSPTAKGGLAVYKLFPQRFDISMDIKPGSDANCVNMNGNGVVPVAIMGTEDLDVAMINPLSLSLSGLQVRMRGNNSAQCNFVYSNEDPYLDLMCHFEDDADNWAPVEGVATLTGELEDGTDIMAADLVCEVPTRGTTSRQQKRK